jgi:AraC family transcriptional regulator of adaptative response / DNA-3-methyladenine glycosylase II
MQQHKIYERARLARDARFDGQFYVGVVTTGIYCRPICPANSPKSENIKFFPSAAAAGEAGFRPCLRCRPECAPGLRRLFTRHIGASPLAVAHTQRLHFAKRLIDETTLPLNHIGVAAGFGSTRRFNDTFKSTYGRSPRELRRVGHEDNELSPDATLSVRLPYRQPFAWSAMLDFIRHLLTPVFDAVFDNCYRRTLLFVNRHAVV